MNGWYGARWGLTLILYLVTMLGTLLVLLLVAEVILRGRGARRPGQDPSFAPDQSERPGDRKTPQAA
jgi:hypothetical protein